MIERQGSNAATDAPPVGADKLPNVPTTPYGNYVCPGATVLGLQGKSQKDIVNSTIDSYSASGATAGHIGSAWGWYLLSPQWASVLGSSAPGDYEDKEIRKHMIIMSDGEFNTSYLTGGTTSAATQSDESYAQFRSLCDGIKGKDITIYTVGFDLTNARLRFRHVELLRCENRRSIEAVVQGYRKEAQYAAPRELGAVCVAKRKRARRWPCPFVFLFVRWISGGSDDCRSGRRRRRDRPASRYHPSCRNRPRRSCEECGA